MMKKTIEVKHFNDCTVSCLVYPIILEAERTHIVGGNGRFPSKTLRTGKADVGKGWVRDARGWRQIITLIKTKEDGDVMKRSLEALILVTELK
jgi:hypothetical protein